MGEIHMGFTDPFKKIPCPFCNKEFSPGQCPIVSGVTGTVLYTPPGGKLWSKVRSRVWIKPPSSYKGELATFRCPHCNSDLPPNINEVDDSTTIAIIGDVYSGKSHYITSLIYQLKKLQIPNKYFHVIAASQEIEKQYQTNYRDLFDLQQPLEQNKEAAVLGDPINHPLIYQITVGEDPDAMKRFNIMIYDASGEDLAKQVSLVRDQASILNAQALIFLADPWAMPRFVDDLSHRLRPTVQLARMPAEFLSWIVQTFKAVRPELAQEFIFPLPTAIVIPKADLIEYHTLLGQEREYDRLWRPDYASVYNNDGQEVDMLVRKLLNSLDEGALLNVAQGFRDLRFFAISATGSAPDDQNKYSRGVKPLRCLDPLLWILKALEKLD
jgi:Double-GTPase 2